MKDRPSLVGQRQLERRADALLDACAASGRALEPPVPVEWLAEHILDLCIVWEVLPTDEASPVLGGLDPVRGEIVLNEAETRRFAAFPGLEAFTLAHEIGHWLLHVPPPRRRQPMLPGWERSRLAACGGGGLAARREQDADRFAALLLMPRRLLLPRCERLDLTRFPARYKLRDQFGVSITAMNLRLKDLGFGTFNAKDEYIPGRATRAGMRKAKVARPAPLFAAG
jgi:Zn-dependent peptidase ImmA (M78 family)